MKTKADYPAIAIAKAIAAAEEFKRTGQVVKF